MNYLLRRKAGSGRWGTWGVVHGPDRRRVKGLTDGTVYSFELKAVNGVGEGAAAAATGTPGAADTAPPVLRRAHVDGAALRLLFDESLGNPPLCNAFTVRVNGAVRASRATVVGGDAVNVALAAPVLAGEAVTVDYMSERVCLGPLEDASGNPVADFRNLRVRNRTPEDTAAPVLTGATVAGAVLRLVWDEALDGGARPPGTAFTVTVAGGARGVARVSVEGAAVVLRLAAPVLIGEAVTVGYAARGGVRDRSGNRAAGFAARRVENRTRAARPVAVALGSSPRSGSGGVYGLGAMIVATVRFDRAVEVSGAPELELEVGGEVRAAAYIDGAPGTELRFGYRVAADDADDDGVGIRGGSLSGGAIADAGGTAARTDNPAGGPYDGHRVETEGPGRPVVLTFDHKVRGTRVAGGTIDVLAVWIGEDGMGVDTDCTDATIAERCGTPYVRLKVGGEERKAWYEEAERTVVRFRYEVRVGDDGAVRIDGREALQGNGGAITDAAGNPALDLRAGRASDNSISADTAAPALSGATVNGTLLTLTWSERLQRRPAPAPSAFVVRVDGAAVTPVRVRRSNREVRLYLSAAVTGGAEVRVDYTPPLSNAVADEVGHEALGFVDEAVTNESPAVAPGAPAALSAVPGNGAVALAWEAPGNDGGTEIERYEWRHRAAGEAFEAWTAAGDGEARERTVPGLDNGTEYEFELRAVNAAGAGEAVTAAATPRAGAAAPGLPRSFEAAPGDGAVTLTWREPASDGGSAVVRYEWRHREAGGAFGAWRRAGGRAAREYTARRLDNGTEYEFELRAVNGVGAGAAVTAAATPGAAPGRPRSFDPEAGNREVALTWREPASDGGSAIVRYELRWREAGGTFGVWAPVGVGAAREYTVDNLANGTEYEFELRAVNRAGFAGRAAEADATPATVPAAPELEAAADGRTAIELGWSAPDNGGAAILRYELEVSDDGGEVWTPAGARLGPTAVRWTDTPLAAGATKHYRLRAVNRMGDGAWSAWATASTDAAGRPSAPRDLKAAPGDGAVTLTWEAPADDGGAAVERYEARYGARGGAFRTWVRAGGVAAREYTVPSLDNGTAYAFELRAVNAAGLAGAAAAEEATPSDDLTAPAFVRAWVNGDTLTMEFNEALREGAASTPAPINFSVKVGEENVRPTAVEVAGKTVVLTLAAAVTAADRVLVRYDPPTDADLNPVAHEALKDLAGNLAAAVRWQAPENRTPAAPPANALTATVGGSLYHTVRHNGSSDRPQVVLTFNRAVAAIALDTTSVTVGNGRLVSVGKLGSTREANDWLFRIAPAGNGPVTFTVVANQPCGGSTKGICTADGTQLYTDAVHEIPGPRRGTSSTLTAQLVDSSYQSDRHTGRSDRPQVIVQFNQPVAPIDPGTASVTVTGGRLTGAGELRGTELVANDYIFYLAPSGDGPITFTLVANQRCGGSAKGICTLDGAPLSRITGDAGHGISGPAGTAAATAGAPTVTGAAVSAGSGGADAGGTIEATVRFSEPVTVDASGGTPSIGIVAGSAARRASYARGSGTAALVFAYTVTAADGAVGGAWVAEDALSLGGGTIRSAAGVDADLAYDLAPSVRGVTVLAPGDDGRWDAGDAAEVRVRFSEPVTVAIEDGTPSIGIEVGAEKRRAVYARGSGTAALVFAYTVTAADGAVDGVIVPADGLALGGGAIRDRGGNDAVLAHGAVARAAEVEAQADGPALRVADARAREGEDAAVEFTVTLAPAASGTVTVDYASADGTAKAGEDYTAASGTLVFAPGETEKTIAVALLDDAVDEGEESFALRLSNAAGAALADAEATGAIVNSDPLPKAWLGRFGRTAAVHVVEAVGERLGGSPSSGAQVTIAGLPLPTTGAAGSAAPEAPAWDGRAWTGHPWDGAQGGARSLTGRELLAGSSFRLSPGAAAGAPDVRWTAWGRGAASRFDGKDEGLAVDGDVTTFTLGADAAWARWLAGVAVAHSIGEGAFRDHSPLAGGGHPERGSGRLESALTSVHPYVRYQASERLSVWGILGYGAGDLTLKRAGSGTLDADTAMRMAAAGARGVLAAAAETGGLELAARADALVMRIESDAAGTAAGRLAASEADAARLRLVLEGSRAFDLGRGTLTPSLELGLRHDGGDAETGTGVEAAAGVRYADPSRGLVLEARVRGLVAHEDSDYREWGASGALRIDPGASGRGLSLTLTPSFGAASSGVERLWSQHGAAELAPDGNFEPAGRLEAEVGYGLGAFDGRGVHTPYAGVSLSNAGERIWRLGWRLNLGPDATLEVVGTRRNSADDTGHGLMLRAAIRW